MLYKGFRFIDINSTTFFDKLRGLAIFLEVDLFILKETGARQQLVRMIS